MKEGYKICRCCGLKQPVDSFGKVWNNKPNPSKYNLYCDDCACYRSNFNSIAELRLWRWRLLGITREDTYLKENFRIPTNLRYIDCSHNRNGANTFLASL